MQCHHLAIIVKYNLGNLKQKLYKLYNLKNIFIYI